MIARRWVSIEGELRYEQDESPTGLQNSLFLMRT